MESMCDMVQMLRVEFEDVEGQSPDWDCCTRVCRPRDRRTWLKRGRLSRSRRQPTRTSLSRTFDVEKNGVCIRTGIDTGCANYNLVTWTDQSVLTTRKE